MPIIPPSAEKTTEDNERALAPQSIGINPPSVVPKNNPTKIGLFIFNGDESLPK